MDRYYIDNRQLPTPEDGVAITVVRHFPLENHLVLHERRAALVHGLVDELSIDVQNWGETDAPHATEVIEVVMDLVPSVIGAAAVIIAGWLARPKTPPEKSRGVESVGFKTADGSELRLSYGSRTTRKERARLINAFLAAAAGTGAPRKGRRKKS